MNQAHAVAIRARAALVWLTVTAAGAGLAVLAVPLAASRPAPTATFADLLVQCCAGAALVAVALLWLLIADVVLEVWRSPRCRRVRTGRLRAALLTACGVAALSTASPALGTSPDGPEPPTGAAPAHLLSGLPLPDRAHGEGRPPRSAPMVVAAQPGDSLWSIAADALDAGASEAELASYWSRVVTLHAGTGGADPDLIQPGQQVRLPPP